MVAVEGARCLRAAVTDSANAQVAAVFASSVEASIHVIGTGPFTLCARDACRALRDVCDGCGPAQAHALRCGAIDILLAAVQTRGACAPVAADALAALVALPPAADAAMQSGALAVLQPLLTLSVQQAQHGCGGYTAGLRSGAAAAMAALVANNLARADSFVSAGGLSALEATFGDLIHAASIASTQQGSHSAMACNVVRSPRATGVSPSQPAAPDALVSWQLQRGSSSGAEVPHRLGVGQLSSQRNSSSAALGQLAKGSPVTAATRQPKLVRMQLVLRAAAPAGDVVAICKLAVALAQATPVVQAKMRDTQLLQHLVRLHHYLISKFNSQHCGVHSQSNIKQCLLINMLAHAQVSLLSTCDCDVVAAACSAIQALVADDAHAKHALVVSSGLDALVAILLRGAPVATAAAASAQNILQVSSSQCVCSAYLRTPDNVV